MCLTGLAAHLELTSVQRPGIAPSMAVLRTCHYSAESRPVRWLSIITMRPVSSSALPVRVPTGVCRGR